MPASELVSSTNASSSIKSDISLWRSSASSVISESVVEKVGEGVRSARRSLTQPWKMGVLRGLVVWEQWREPRKGDSKVTEELNRPLQLVRDGFNVTFYIVFYNK